jgi:hypothetical protein
MELSSWNMLSARIGFSYGFTADLKSARSAMFTFLIKVGFS